MHFLKPHSVYAFCGENAQGNLAGVCLLDHEISTKEMQQIATRFGASETAFILKNESGFSLRWFTPSVEVSLCGHATMASAFFLWQKGGLRENSSLKFETKGGVIECHMDSNHEIFMKFPILEVKEKLLEPRLLSSLGVNNALYTGITGDYVFIEVASEMELRNLKPDFEALMARDPLGYIVTCKGDARPYDFLSRCFYPKEGIFEDPVTGSAHCALGYYWREKMGQNHFLAYQASREGGVLRVSVLNHHIVLAGRASFAP